MKNKAEQKVLAAKSRNILEKREVFDLAIREITEELALTPINESTSFLTAKETIRREGVREGMKTLLTRISKYASYDG